MAAKFEVYKGKRGDFRFRLKAANGKVICDGQGYQDTRCRMQVLILDLGSWILHLTRPVPWT